MSSLNISHHQDHILHSTQYTQFMACRSMDGRLSIELSRLF